MLHISSRRRHERRRRDYLMDRTVEDIHRSLDGLARFTNVRTLVIASYPNADVAPPAHLRRLHYLSPVHLPNVTDLTLLGEPTELRTLRLATLPSWDSSGKVTTVDSLQPLAELPHLAQLELFGVRPESRSLGALESSRSLRTARVSTFPRREIERLREETGLGDAWAPRPPVANWS
ncbi:hypothetical protein [Aeromicrobium sp.]|uniref:hypothetical protein n=1 Tax=Aeromicrobium sp. TaxID=1871063 RepID=UPI0040337C8C